MRYHSHTYPEVMPVVAALALAALLAIGHQAKAVGPNDVSTFDDVSIRTQVDPFEVANTAGAYCASIGFAGASGYKLAS